MSEIHLKHPDFSYSACGPFTKTKERIERFLQTGNTNVIYQYQLIIINWQMSFITHYSKVQKKKSLSIFRDNIWGVYLADMQLLSKYNKGNKYLLCAIDLFSKYVWIVPLKNKKRD